jgi:hypothetical protein
MRSLFYVPDKISLGFARRKSTCCCYQALRYILIYLEYPEHGTNLIGGY